MPAARQRSGSSGPGAAFRELILETFRLNGRLVVATDRLGRRARLSAARWQVLHTIEEEAQPVAHIARHLGLSRQSVQRTVDLLAKEGLVSFAENPHHRRAKLVVLTGAARTALGQLRTAQRQWTERIARGMTPEDLLTASHTLRELRARLDRS